MKSLLTILLIIASQAALSEYRDAKINCLDSNGKRRTSLTDVFRVESDGIQVHQTGKLLITAKRFTTEERSVWVKLDRCISTIENVVLLCDSGSQVQFLDQNLSVEENRCKLSRGHL